MIIVDLVQFLLNFSQIMDSDLQNCLIIVAPLHQDMHYVVNFMVFDS